MICSPFQSDVATIYWQSDMDGGQTEPAGWGIDCRSPVHTEWATVSPSAQWQSCWMDERTSGLDSRPVYDVAFNGMRRTGLGLTQP